MALVLTAVLAWCAEVHSEEVSTKIQVKRAGLIAKDRFLTIALCDAEGNTSGLTDEALAAAPKRFFLCRGADDWDPGKGFFEKEIHRLAIQQKERAFSAVAKTISEGEQGTQCVIGYFKDVSLETPVVFIFQIDDTRVSATLSAPEKYWDRYSWSKQRYDAGTQAQNNGQWKEAIESLFPLYEDASLKKFSFYPEAMDALDLSYGAYVLSPYRNAVADLDNAEAKVASDPSAAKALYLRAREGFAHVGGALKGLGVTEATLSLQRPDIADAYESVGTYQARVDNALSGIDANIEQWQIKKDLETVRWTHVATSDHPKYVALLDAFCPAILSLDYSLPLKEVREAVVALGPPADQSLHRDVRTTFGAVISQTRRLFKKKQWALPQPFMANLRKNAQELPQPYAETLQAVELFLQGKPSEQAVDSAISAATDEALLLGLGALREEIRASLENVPASARAKLREAVRAAGREDYPAASALLDEALRLAPGYPHALIYHGRVQRQQGNTEYAGGYLEEAAERDPGSLLAVLELERVYREAKTPTRLSGPLKDAVADRGDVWWFQQHLGDLLFEEGSYRKAARAYERALQLNPHASPSRHKLSDTHLRLADYEKAEEALKGQQDPVSRKKLAALKALKRVSLPQVQDRIFFQDLQLKENKKGQVVLRGQLINANARVPRQIDLIGTFYDVRGKQLGKGIRSVPHPEAFQVTPFEIAAPAAYAQVARCGLEVTLIDWR